MKKLFSLLIVLFSLVACTDEDRGTDIPKFDTSEIKKKDTVQVMSLFNVPQASANSNIVNPYDLHCGALPPYRDSIRMRGHWWGFCSKGCLTHFTNKPSNYLK